VIGFFDVMEKGGGCGGDGGVSGDEVVSEGLSCFEEMEAGEEVEG